MNATTWEHVFQNQLRHNDEIHQCFTNIVWLNENDGSVVYEQGREPSLSFDGSLISELFRSLQRPLASVSTSVCMNHKKLFIIQHTASMFIAVSKGRQMGCIAIYVKALHGIVLAFYRWPYTCQLAYSKLHDFLQSKLNITP